MSFEKAFDIISELVKDFKANEESFVSHSYSEAQLRNDFLNKFFIALGWDVRHEEQKNPYEQEVRVEKPLQIAKAQKRADYSFSLAPDYRTVKFFVEAKKPAHDLSNKDYYFQTARYGWNAGTPVAVLTDFEEFHIVDCRFRPNIDDALNYKVQQFHYSDYADKEKFSEIYWLFSREAVADGSIEKYAKDKLAKPKGKKAKLTKTVLQSIDEAFLEELDEIRNDLAKSFKKNNEHLSSEELTEATQRTIDRLVFIKFLEDKLIEPDHYVSAFGRRKSAWEDFLLDSRKLDAKYNGVVFKKSLIDSRNLIEPDEKTFSAICDELSHENTPYNFDAIPIHILGSIYERFLGKVVHATDKRVTIEEKPEVRKAGGVYYTPQYIVDYIVKNTVGKLIENKTPKQIAKMHFADIACGSGSFLITVFETILDYHKKYYLQNTEQAKKDGCILYEGAYRLSLKQKQQILTNNIYGVDIDQQAVEVTQLSLYLKLLEDETTATANDTWVFFKEQLLPDLNKNIVCGNSLIGTDILAQQSSLPFVKGGTEGGLDELKLKPMDFEKVFPHIFPSQSGGGPARQSMKDEDGFDAIVGNPPYVLLSQDIHTKLLINYLLNYETAYYKVDLFHLFIQRGIDRLKENGTLGFIVPNPWLTLQSSFKLRKYILDHTQIDQLVIFEQKVFKEADVYTTLIFLERGKPRKDHKVKIKKSTHSVSADDIIKIEDIYILQNQWLGDEEYKFETRTIGNEGELAKKIMDSFPRLDSIARASLGCQAYNRTKHTRSQIQNRVFHADKKLTNEYLSELAGNDVNRYLIVKKKGTWIKYGPWLHDYRTMDWLEGPRNLIREIPGSSPYQIQACYVEETYCNYKTILNVSPSNNTKISMKYLCGLLNSRLLSFVFPFTSNKIVAKSFPRLSVGDVKRLPIRNINLNDKNEIELHNKMISLVDQLLTTKKQLQQAKTEGDKNYLERKCSQLDKEIDQLVYQLYGLTEEEIKIVEGK